MRFNVMDLETTGFSSTNDKIIEVAAVKFEHGKEIARISFLINPEVEISQRITEVNNITNAMVKDKPLIQHVMNEVAQFCGDDLVIGHNLIGFDKKFIDFTTNTHSTDAPTGLVFCSLEMAKQAISKYDIMNYKLGTLLEYFKIPVEKKSLHRAVADCHYNGLLVYKLLEKLNIKSVEELDKRFKGMKFVQPAAQKTLF